MVSGISSPRGSEDGDDVLLSYNRIFSHRFIFEESAVGKKRRWGEPVPGATSLPLRQTIKNEKGWHEILQ
jgi:hypothetical protein